LNVLPTTRGRKVADKQRLLVKLTLQFNGETFFFNIASLGLVEYPRRRTTRAITRRKKRTQRM
jgi:hypothetical protein